ncbi:MAG: flagellar FlbD family protein [Planctomycetota bacterium]
MINVTRLNGGSFVLNAEQIRTVESKPDTVITLLTGDHMVVQESVEQVVERVIEYGRSLRRMMPMVEPAVR